MTIEFRSGDNRLAADDRRADGAERLAERLQAATTAFERRHRGRDCDDLPFELAGTDRPVDGVLQGTGQAVPVLGRCDEHGVAFFQPSPPSHHTLRRAGRLDIGIEMWQRSKTIEQDDLHTRRSGGSGSMQQPRVR